MNIYVKIFLEKNQDLIDNIPKLIEKADESSILIYNDLIDTLVDANIIDASDPLAKHKIEFNEDDLEDLIESQLPYECRTKYLDLKQSVIDNSIEFLYISQEDMYQDAVNKIIVCLNNFISDSSKDLIGVHVTGKAYCRDTSHKTFPINFEVVDKMTSYEQTYQYYVVISQDDAMYADVIDILYSDSNYDAAYEKAYDCLSDSDITEEYEDCYILLVKAAVGLDINKLSGSDLMSLVEDSWRV